MADVLHGFAPSLPERKRQAVIGLSGRRPIDGRTTLTAISCARGWPITDDVIRITDNK